MKREINTKEVMNSREASEYIGVGRKQLQTLYESYNLPYYKNQKTGFVLFVKREVDAYMKGEDFASYNKMRERRELASQMREEITKMKEQEREREEREMLNERDNLLRQLEELTRRYSDKFGKLIEVTNFEKGSFQAYIDFEDLKS